MLSRATFPLIMFVNLMGRYSFGKLYSASSFSLTLLELITTDCTNGHYSHYVDYLIMIIYVF